MVTNPDWLRKPSGAETDEYFPQGLTKAAVDGNATVNCTVALTGLLHDCVVVSETPRGVGVGASAIGLASKFQMKPLMIDGVPTESQVSVPVRFQCTGCTKGPSAPPTGSMIPQSPGTRQVFLEGVWTAAPSFEQWKASYPGAAATAGVSGGASFECAIRDDGSLTGCSTKNETPGKMGFAAAARSLIPYFRTHPDLAGRKPQPRIILTIAYPKAQLDKARASASPSFSRAVTLAEIDEAFPDIASDEKIPFGRAVVQCVLADDGAPSGCTVRSETPAAKGFGAAGAVVAPKLRFNMWSAEGTPVNRTIVIPLAFGAPPRGEEDISTLVDRTERFISAGQLAEARVEAAEIRRRFPNDPGGKRILSVLGAALSASKNPDAQRLNHSCWTKAVAGKDLDAAIADCDRALQLEPTAPDYFDSRALAYLRSGDLAHAIADYNAALELYPEDAHPMFGRGLTKLRMGDTAGADADMKAALALDSTVEGKFAGYGVRR